MKRRDFITLLGGAAAWPLAASAQQAESTRRLGVLMPFEAQDSFGRAIVSALREGLQERGWADGRNIRIDERWIGGDDERRTAYAAELVRSSPDVIFACFAGQLGKLVRVLGPFAPMAPGVFLYYPGHRQIMPKLRAFIDHVKSRANVANKAQNYFDDKRSRSRKRG